MLTHWWEIVIFEGMKLEAISDSGVKKLFCPRLSRIQILRQARFHRPQHDREGEDGQAERRRRPRRPAQRGHLEVGLQRARHTRLRARLQLQGRMSASSTMETGTAQSLTVMYNTA